MKNGEKRKRMIQKKIRLTEEEARFISTKVAESGMTNFNAFARIMLIMGEVKILNFEELKWLNFYILIYGNQSYGKNTFFEFKLNKNNLIYHLQVWNIIENKKFKSESISLLVKALSSKAGV